MAGAFRLRALLGDPDLLRKQESGYVAGDIKSGSGEEGPEDNSKPKIHYAVQLGLYTDILERKGLSAGRHAFVWDIHGREVPYDFQTPYGKRSPRTLWQDYEEALRRSAGDHQQRIDDAPGLRRRLQALPLVFVVRQTIEETDDLTMIPELGRSKRDVMYGSVSRPLRSSLSTDPESFVNGNKSVFPGIGPDTIRKFHERAKLLSAKDGKPYTREPIAFPDNECELFFDIEVDPMRDICYLHGFVERLRRDNATEKFVHVLAEAATPEAEKRAFADAWTYIQDRQPCTIYYYSKYERTIYRALQEKYPDICSADDIERAF